MFPRMSYIGSRTKGYPAETNSKVYGFGKTDIRMFGTTKVESHLLWAELNVKNEIFHDASDLSSAQSGTFSKKNDKTATCKEQHSGASRY